MPLRAAADDLLAGKILAVKGLGGYHLACRADSEEAVAALRGRKRREDRPFALLVADVEAARALVELGRGRGGAADLARAADRARAPPAGRRRSRRRSRRNAPDLGLMLPYTPLHQLLRDRRRRAARA